MALEAVAGYITDFTNFAYIPLAIMLIYCVIKGFTGGESKSSWGGGGEILGKAKDFWSDVVRKKETEKREPEEQAVRETEKEAKAVKKAEKREEKAIINEFLWLEECKDAILKYYETDGNLHKQFRSDTSPKMRKGLHERVEKRDLRRLAKYSEVLLKRLSELEKESSGKYKSEIDKWKKQIEVYEHRLIAIMSINPMGEFERVLTTPVLLTKGTEPYHNQEVKEKFEKLIALLREAQLQVRELDAIEKEIHAKLGV